MDIETAKKQLIIDAINQKTRFRFSDLHEYSIYGGKIEAKVSTPAVDNALFTFEIDMLEILAFLYAHTKESRLAEEEEGQIFFGINT